MGQGEANKAPPINFGAENREGTSFCHSLSENLRISNEILKKESKLGATLKNPCSRTPSFKFIPSLSATASMVASETILLGTLHRAEKPACHRAVDIAPFAALAPASRDLITPTLAATCPLKMQIAKLPLGHMAGGRRCMSKLRLKAVAAV